MPAVPPPPLLVLHHFRHVRDPRQRSKVTYSLEAILLTVFAAVLSGLNEWDEMALFARERGAWLRTLVPMPATAPSADTLRRVFERLNPREFARAFEAWTAARAGRLAGGVVAVDGKSVQGAEDPDAPTVPLHLVHVFVVGGQKPSRIDVLRRSPPNFVTVFVRPRCRHERLDDAFGMLEGEPMDTTLRLLRRAACGQMRMLCEACDKGRITCSEACSLARRREAVRRAGRRYRRTARGAAPHAARQQRYRARRAGVTHPASETRPTSATGTTPDEVPGRASSDVVQPHSAPSLASSTPSPRVPGMPRCTRCDRLCSGFFRARPKLCLGRHKPRRQGSAWAARDRLSPRLGQQGDGPPWPC